ncbi:ornithine cyclodeaminase family protein [Methylovirgula sp. 4M-Z18]|uniref:ornithine cyclodeaminase family protein n=1 Tax=Methylovirgula sp. 4M-Z18 TaxID=2293567 RepID=UPI000E2EE0DE|nr:ornithine cyclodeaminase family protein [Methylovirgula sp. 4M-Z18]RFB75634.1 ornithine cyclodeaminase family protein [Methylovirgula sp. 4M-Z18]
MTLTLSEEAIARVLTYEQLIPLMEKTLSAFSAGRAIQPMRNVLTIEEGKRFLGVMPAVSEDGMGAKLVCFYPKNAGTGIPTHLAMIMLFDPETGKPLAFLDGRLITEMRTAAVSAAVTKHLAPEGGKILTLLGSGIQAHAHLQALRHVCDFEEVRVWSRTRENAQRFSEQHNATAMDLETAVRGADVVVTATLAVEPILKGEWLKQGAHVNAIGAARPTWRELDDAAMRNTLVVDSREAALKESGDVILSKAAIIAEVGEIFSSFKNVPRFETTIFKSVGIAVEDIATARLVYDSIGSDQRDRQDSLSR